MKFIKTTKSIFITLCLLTSFSFSQTYTIGVESLDFLPFYTSKTGEYQGAARDILDAFAKDKGYQFIYKSLPINPLMVHLITGQIDMKFPDSPYWKKDMKKGLKLSYSSPVLKYTDGVIVTKANKGKGKDQIKNLGVMLGFTPWEYLGDIKSGKIQQRDNPSFEGMFTLLQSGQYNGTYINIDVANYMFNHKLKKFQDAFVFDPSLPHTQGEYLASSVKNPQLVDEFTKWLKANQATIQKIKSKYGLK